MFTDTVEYLFSYLYYSCNSTDCRRIELAQKFRSPPLLWTDSTETLPRMRMKKNLAHIMFCRLCFYVCLGQSRVLHGTTENVAKRGETHSISNNYQNSSIFFVGKLYFGRGHYRAFSRLTKFELWTPFFVYLPLAFLEFRSPETTLPWTAEYVGCFLSKSPPNPAAPRNHLKVLSRGRVSSF